MSISSLGVMGEVQIALIDVASLTIPDAFAILIDFCLHERKK